MKGYPWLVPYLEAKKGAVHEFKVEWQAHRFLVGGKQFALIGHDKEGQDIITLKLSPDDGQMMRQQYSDIKPGYYHNKEHWNSVVLAGAVPKEEMVRMCDLSYALVLASLSKKRQKEILETGESPGDESS